MTACLLLIAFSARAEEPRFFTHTAKNGDTLTKLAKRYLINTNDWQIFHKFNVVPNPRQIPLGKPIKIPVSAMRSDVAPIEVIASQGAVASGTRPLARGDRVMEGDKLTTEDGSFVTIKLADGSTLTVQPKSSLRIETARQLVNSGGVTDTVLRLDGGRLETMVARPSSNGARYEIRTPTSNMGVRGTMFRVGADDTGKRAQGEVVEGLVAVTASSGKAPATSVAPALALRAGFGSFVEAGKPPSPPIVLLAAPDITKLPALFQQPDVRFVFPQVSEAVSYRAQVATDKAFTNPLAAATSGTPDVAFSNLPDGALFLRVRAIDVNGLEGKDASHPFTVKARPLPPTLALPADNARVSAEKVALVWQPSADAVAYRVQVAGESSFVAPTTDEKKVSGLTFSPALILKSVPYFWRVASVNANGDIGPWSQTRSFLGAAEVPALKTRRGDGNTSLEIDGSIAPSHQVQIARDVRFSNLTSDRVIIGNKFDLSGIPVNTYYVRVRAVVGSDQVLGGWSEPRLLEVYPLRGGWWLSETLQPQPPAVSLPANK